MSVPPVLSDDRGRRGPTQSVDLDPRAFDSNHESWELLDLLPVALLVVDAGGRVLLANDTARARLELRQDDVDRTSVTRVGATRRRDDGAPFLLSVARVPRLRFTAREIEWRTGTHTPVRILAIDTSEGPTESDAAALRARLRDPLESVDRAVVSLIPDGEVATSRNAIDLLRRRLRDLRLAIDAPIADGAPDPSRLRAVPARALFAEVVRRMRRHYAGLADRPFTTTNQLRGDERTIHAHPLAITQVMLTMVHLLTMDVPGSRVAVEASFVGCRLRLAVVTPVGHSGELPELRRRRPLIQSLLPILTAHQATLELHRDSRGRSSARITLPALPARPALPVLPAPTRT